MYRKIPAAFYRGGTSKAVIFRASDLPSDRATRDAIFLHVLGSPDPYGRQLDGLGGGLSSLSKVVILEPSAMAGVDIDYTFVQIAVDSPVADYGSMCGNMSSSVGPFAVDEGMVRRADGPAVVTVRNTNTDKIYRAHFEVRDGLAVEEGDFTLPGVDQPGARIRLDFQEPGGAATGRLLPGGAVRQTLDVPGLGAFEASLIDASNPVAFIHARDVGLTATENPAELDTDQTVMAKLDAIRRVASVAMGMSGTAEDAILSNPKIAVIAPPQNFTALDGRAYSAADCDLCVRLVSMGNMHRAITLTGAMCLAVGAKIPGSILYDLAPERGDIRIGNPSGVLPVGAEVEKTADGFHAMAATTYRTQRRIMEGFVRVPETLLR